jgi:hypothetical protein
MKNKYTKEQIKAMYDLCYHFKIFAHTTGEINRLEEAKADLLNKSVSFGSVLKSNIQ